ncbi:MAG TPA: DUF1802 family protein [Methanobacterium sp.]|nr:DUF1802 family protein [Methanobacterium sp.]
MIKTGISMATNTCLKEWNATVEALGNGRQTILIRKYKTHINEFLLYPTVTYTSKNNYLDSFQDKYRDFVKLNSLPDKKENKVLIKYFAMLDKIVKKPVSKISDKYFIWTAKHVKSYAARTAYIWILRVYKLKEPYWAGPKTGTMTFAHLKDEVSLEGMEPVLSDYEYSEIIKQWDGDKVR